jgi:small-conductance mechanosensitive channel
MSVLLLQAAPAGQADLETLQTLLATGWLDVLRAILALVLAIIGRRLVLNWTGSAMRRARVDTGTQILVKRALSTAFVVAAVLIVLGILGVNTAGLVTVVGAVGLAFSLAMQDILKNFFSGVYLLLERPFRVGDTIRVRDQEGVVENIGVRTTSLRTPDNVYVLVPNMIVFAEVVANRSHAQVGHPATAGADGQAARETDAPLH